MEMEVHLRKEIQGILIVTVIKQINISLPAKIKFADLDRVALVLAHTMQ